MISSALKGSAASSLYHRIAWIDLADATAFTESAGVITGVTNKITGVVWNGGGALPGYNATGFNTSFPTMTFNGTTQHVLASEAAIVSALSDQKDYIIYIVGQVNTADSAFAMFGVGNSAQATASRKRWGTVTTGAGRWSAAATNAANTAVNVESAGGSNTSAHVFAFYARAGTTFIKVGAGATPDPNGGAQAVSTCTPNRYAIGAQPQQTIAQFLNGNISEIQIYRGAHHNSAIDIVMAQLTAKWGL